MNKQTYSSSVFLKKILSFLLLFLFLSQVFFLYLNTHPNYFDGLETIKIVGPLSILFFFTILNRPTQNFLIKFMVFILYTHILIALIYLTFNFSNSITSDNRLVLSLLGRSPGATAQIFCLALIVKDYYLKEKIHGYKNLRIIINIVFILIILFTQSRVYYLFLFIYFLMNYWGGIINLFRSLYFNLAAISITGLLLYTGIFKSIYERSQPSKLFSGRDQIWSQFLQDYFNRDEVSILFGFDLSRHEIIVNEISYQTSDVHNTFFDIMNYYGLITVIILSFWYLFSSGFFKTKKSFVILVAYLPILVTTSIFKYPLAFYSSLLILMLPIYFSNAKQTSNESRKIKEG